MNLGDQKPEVSSSSGAKETDWTRMLAADPITRQSELLHSILNNMGEAVLVASTEQKLLLFNPAAATLFELGPPKEEVGRLLHPRGFFQADTSTPLTAEEAPLSRCIRGEEVNDLEMFVRRPHAPAGIWLSVTGRPLRDAHGHVIGGVIVCRDITEQKRIETALRESEGLYQSLVQQLPQNVFRKDAQGRITFANSTYCKTIKMSLEQLIGKTDFDLFPADLASKYVEDDRSVMRTGVSFEAVEIHRLQSGARIHVQVVKTPVYDAHGAIVGVQGIFWDVTARVRAEEILTASERHYRQLTEATLDGIILADCNAVIQLFNPAAERMFGYRAAEVIGQKISTLVAHEYRAAHEAGFKRYLETQQPRLIGRTAEVLARHKDGSAFPVEIALNVLSSAAESFHADAPASVQFLASIRDLTERNKLRAVLLQNEKLASIGLLSAGIAHEINNPISFVANNLSVLERDAKALTELVDLYTSTREELARFAPELASQIRALEEKIELPYLRENLVLMLARTRDGVERVSRIVQSLRGFARTDAPDQQLVHIPDLIQSSLEILHGRFRQSGIAVEQDHAADPRVTCVQTQLSQVILNLLVNAFQAVESYRKKGGRVSIRTRRQGPEMLIEVEDNGPGIKPEHLARLFDPFFTTKEVGEGTGLGLAISHNIVEAHGGHIEVDSSVNEGATFRVYLPLARQS